MASNGVRISRPTDDSRESVYDGDLRRPAQKFVRTSQGVVIDAR
jgi:hypothetical protein